MTLFLVCLSVGSNRLEGSVRVVSDEGQSFACPDSLDRRERSISLEGVIVEIVSPLDRWNSPLGVGIDCRPVRVASDSHTVSQVGGTGCR